MCSGGAAENFPSGQYVKYTKSFENFDFDFFYLFIFVGGRGICKINPKF